MDLLRDLDEDDDRPEEASREDDEEEEQGEKSDPTFAGEKVEPTEASSSPAPASTTPPSPSPGPPVAPAPFTAPSNRRSTRWPSTQGPNHKLGFIEDADISTLSSTSSTTPSTSMAAYAADPSGLSHVGDLETLAKNQALSIYYNMP